MSEKTKNLQLIIVSILLVISLLGNFLFAVDNGALIEENEVANQLVEEYEVTFDRQTKFSNCMDGLEQYTVDNEVVVKVLDIKSCVDSQKGQ